MTDRERKAEAKAPEALSSIVPRPRPGFKTRRPEVSAHLKAAFFAAAFKSSVGVFCLATSVLYLPAHKVTPILSGVSLMMLVLGCHALWKVGRDEPRLARYTRPLLWAFPLASLLVFGLMLLVGPGGLGPTWQEILRRG